MKALRSLDVATWFALFLALLLSACAVDGGLSAGSTLRNVDNDVLDKTDDQYTSGISLSYVSETLEQFEDGPLPGSFGRWLDERWPFVEQQQRFVIWSVAQRLFTPTDLAATEVVEGDLPYSGLLYGTLTTGSQSRDRLDAFSLTAGVVGPLALGKEVQTAVHRAIGSEIPQGWDNQLDNEPLVNVGYDQRRRLLRVGSPHGFGADLLTGLSASAGNLQTQLSLGATVRAGLRVPSNFHMQAPFLTEEALGLRAYDVCACTWAAYLFGGVGATALANAIYLDGNTFSDSASVDHDSYILRGTFGGALRYEQVLLSIAMETATIPWEQPDGLDRETFARFSLSFDF